MVVRYKCAILVWILIDDLYYFSWLVLKLFKFALNKCFFFFYVGFYCNARLKGCFCTTICAVKLRLLCRFYLIEFVIAFERWSVKGVVGKIWTCRLSVWSENHAQDYVLFACFDCIVSRLVYYYTSKLGAAASDLVIIVTQHYLFKWKFVQLKSEIWPTCVSVVVCMLFLSSVVCMLFFLTCAIVVEWT